MLVINSLPEAEKFVDRQKKLGNTVRWENYDIIFFREAPQAVYSTEGVVRDGRFGFDNRSEVQDDGTWSIDYRNVRRATKSSGD